MKVGVLGGGQLGRMMAIAGYPLGIEFGLFDPAKDACGGQVAKLHNSPFEVTEELKKFVDEYDVFTYEFENVPLELAEYISQHKPLYPGKDALYYSQHRLREKQLFVDLGVPVTKFSKVDDRASLLNAGQEVGIPFILKTTTLGYDGKGQYRVTSEAELAELADKLFPEDGEACEHTTYAGVSEYIAEAFVNFTRELSIISVRDQAGNCVFYSPAENEHRDGILHLSVAPAANLSDEKLANLQSYARKLLEKLDYVGVLSIEFFETDEGLVVNEFAPRVHNSGHWSMEGSITGQFENHIRAICGLPLGDTTNRSVSAMYNLVGHDVNRSVMTESDVHLHWYGKEIKDKRKVGHVNILAENYDSLNKKIEYVDGQII
ncbi:5-(carboxyamino)imidazole ribonucleotide synthase [Litoribrevibacter albus]|uniref:N5-carboxyaminoimidazole ribonucleotide synthase n=1 Tax=Litoribrevibacter albus TaxID=1473156 RepID=A0AA37S9P5_9GAMM|nr:5-(carboxyamino)imidazole ribonucleotide synthase [Litoribrevibacter albus]GLQ31036.1 N5-carboxyaminoimidazole ribonucleotide synthase [Litoribrevibacter albus]